MNFLIKVLQFIPGGFSLFDLYMRQRLLYNSVELTILQFEVLELEIRIKMLRTALDLKVIREKIAQLEASATVRTTG